MKTKADSTRQQVRHLMFLDQRFRDSDKELWLAIAEISGLVLTKAQKFIFMGVPSEEIVARRRREFSKDFPASPQVVEKRYSHYKAMQEEFSPQSWIQRMLHRRRII